MEDGTQRCPLPCGLENARASTRSRLGFDKKCHTTVGGEPCHVHVMYTINQIPDHPNWYPGLSKHATVKEVQHYLYKEVDGHGHHVCPKPCHLNLTDKLVEGCHDTVGGEQCYIHIQETMKVLRENIDEHPD